MKLLFKYPTRERFEWFKTTLTQYYEMLSGRHEWRFVVTLDDNDPQMNSDDAKFFMEGFRFLEFHYGRHTSKVDAINSGMDRWLAEWDWDLLILVSDDMLPQIKGYDDIIAGDMQTHFPGMDGALHYDDGLYGKDKCITLSIMGRHMFENFGYIYHPAYKSFFCDNEFTESVYAMEKCVFIPKVIIRHDWKGHHRPDALYRRNSAMGRDDEDTYNRRKAAGFPTVC